MSRDFWNRQAELPDLRSVVDPRDTVGRKSAYLDCLHRVALRRATRFSADDRVLDFGCGIGRLSRWLAPRVRSVHALDSSEGMVRRARSALAEFPNVCVVAFDGLSIPLRNSTADTLLSVWVLQHILTDVDLLAVLRELARVTRPEGRLVFVERVAEEPEEAWNPPGIIRRRKPGEYERVFPQAGLRCERAFPIWDGSPIWGRKRVQRVVMSRYFPTRLWPVVARVDIALKLTAALEGWGDFVYVCSRE